MDDNVKEILKSMGKSAGRTIIEHVALPLGFIIVIIAAFAFGGVDSGSLSGSGSSSDSSGYSDVSNENVAVDIDTKLKGKNAEKMKKLINRAIEIANDKDFQYYTYSQTNRMGEHSYDCSSFVYRLYKEFFGMELPLTTYGYGTEGYIGTVEQVKNKLQPGDILYRNDHVELYIGNNKRAGAHTDSYAPKDQISIEKGLGDFTSVYRFVK